ncbi:MAG: metallophosphoesterase [Propionibacteriaceae bacterium]|jgi:hypothetical protein|nr:metallophosphoesterase [Propionibacteriaceae bacterium]
MSATMDASPIQALLPRDPAGRQFVLYSDSCSGQVDDPYGNGERLARTSAVVRRLAPRPEFIVFPGDAVADGSVEEQWIHWLGSEMHWAEELGLPIYQATSNHNTPTPKSYPLYRKYWAERLPLNGPAGQDTLAYWVRDGNLLYVSLHQPDCYAEPDSHPVRGLNSVEATWLESVLTANSDADHIFVAGHYPVFPVNGYSSLPWCFTPQARSTLWDILVRNRVTAYLCSHVLAFDIQVHDGVLQVTSGGATGGDPDFDSVPIPHGLMPGPEEFPHIAQLAVDAQGLCCRVHDATGKVREQLAWPPPDLGARLVAAPTVRTGELTPDAVLWLRLSEKGNSHSQLVAAGLRPNAFVNTVEWLRADDGRFVAGFDSVSHRFVIDLELDHYGRQRWHGPALDLSKPAQIELMLHPGMGPGGLLYRLRQSDSWSSMLTSSAVGLEAFNWPDAITATSQLTLAWASNASEELGEIK